MLFIRVDANSQIGTGHLMRCLAIMAEAKRQGIDCTFIVADHGSESILQAHAAPFISLKTRWGDSESELPALLALLECYGVTHLLLDSYTVTERYMHALKSVVRLHYLDDVNAFTYPCHSLINYNCYAKDMDYHERYRHTETKLLLGPGYAPLRAEFRNLPPPVVRPQATRLLITTGGTDPNNVVGRVVQGILANRRLGGMVNHVVAGVYNTHLDFLERLAASHPEQVLVHRQVHQMAGLMRQCDIAVSAGGSTIYELCACGTPTVLFAMADNQLPAAKKLGQGTMVYAGDIRNGAEDVVAHIVNAVECLAKAAEARSRYVIKMQGMVDGYGAARLLKAMGF